jgi:hypothetical protein
MMMADMTAILLCHKCSWLDKREACSHDSSKADLDRKLGLSPYEKYNRLGMRKGRNGADPYSRQSHDTSPGQAAFGHDKVEALVTLARKEENPHKSNNKKFNLARRDVSMLEIKSDEPKPEIGTELFAQKYGLGSD